MKEYFINVGLPTRNYNYTIKVRYYEVRDGRLNFFKSFECLVASYPSHCTIIEKVE